MKYPRTLYWPSSPSIDKDARCVNPSDFINKHVWISEKLDGQCVALHKGKAYLRSTTAPTNAPWAAMVKKHHAWKVQGDEIVYGEDIYGVHSIEYDAVTEDSTFYIFAMYVDGIFVDWPTLVYYAISKGMKVVPMLDRRRFNSVEDVNSYVSYHTLGQSFLGREKEGIVLRVDGEFKSEDFSKYVCKVVRPNHVQTGEHWSRYWKPCQIS